MFYEMSFFRWKNKAFFFVGPNYRNHKRRLQKDLLPIAVSSMMFFFIRHIANKGVGEGRNPHGG